MELRKLNLNLLIHLNLLLDECSVSKAAEKAFLTQTAMSNILKQLRDIFQDELFFREGNQFLPTEYALSLHPKIKGILEEVEELLATKPFDPTVDEFTYNMAFASHGEYLILPKLSAYLTQHAPNICLNVIPLTVSRLKEMEGSEKIHIAIAPQFYEVGKNMIRRSLFHEEPRCFMDANHPLAYKKKLRMEDYISANHVAIVLDENSELTFIDRLLLQSGGERKVKIYAPNLISAIYSLYDSNLIGTFPRYLTRHLIGTDALYSHEVPFAYMQQSIDIIFHRRYMSYSPVRWLVEVIQHLSVRPE